MLKSIFCFDILSLYDAYDNYHETCLEWIGIMISIFQAARYFVYLANKQGRYSLTPLKLQKLLYFAQGWSYVWDDKPLYDASFVAWQYGPVNVSVYALFQKYGSNDIPASEGIETLQDKEAKDTIDAVWRDYGYRSAFELVNLTHLQMPWKKAQYLNQEISNNDIKSYFQSTYC